MLWAKIRVLVEVSLWLAAAFNLAGLFVGFGIEANWRFPIVHVFSTALEALFCTGCVVLTYQLCLRWFGRERLEGLMTTSQVLVSIAAGVLWIAFGKLAHDYEAGLQALNETVSPRVKKQSSRRVLDRLVAAPPLSWWLRDPVIRASFLLTAAYLIRDRDVKLRFYPGIAPMLVLPFIFMLQDRHRNGHGDFGFGIPFSGVFLGMAPLLGLQILKYSQQWQAADIFRVAPLSGPAQLCHSSHRSLFRHAAGPGKGPLAVNRLIEI
jgi:hypothetical protein